MTPESTGTPPLLVWFFLGRFYGVVPRLTDPEDAMGPSGRQAQICSRAPRDAKSKVAERIERSDRLGRPCRRRRGKCIRWCGGCSPSTSPSWRSAARVVKAALVHRVALAELARRWCGAGTATAGKSNDGGIDGHGVLEVNPLVTFKVLFQCKRCGERAPSRRARSATSAERCRGGRTRGSS